MRLFRGEGQLLIDDAFLQEEIRDGYTIPSDVKRSWAAQLKILCMVAEICERHGIRWYADYGTLLGAVRHQGYIPWDDDLDISMPREDYDRIWPYLAAELPSHFHLRSLQTDRTCDFPWGSIRNRSDIDLHGRDPEGAKITAEYYDWPFVAGIDVFPLDHVPVDSDEAEIQKTCYRAVQDILMNFDALEMQGALADAAEVLEELTGVTLPRSGSALKAALWQLDTAVASMYPQEQGAGMTSLYWMVYGTDPIRPYRCFSETVWLPFEMIQIPAPVGYEEILTLEYGDWKVPKKWTQAHGYPYFSEQEDRARIVLEADRLEEEGSYGQEQILLEDGIRKYPKSWELYYLLARAVQHTDRVRAAASLEQALTLCNNAHARNDIEKNLRLIRPGNA